MTLYLSKLRISRHPQVSALNALLDPQETASRMDAHHRLLWSVFAGDPAQRRDFLWREDAKGTFLVLSARPPQESPFFEPSQTRPFVPELTSGDRLAFSLRANATRTEKTGVASANGHEKKRHVDLVMDRLPPRGQRAEARMDKAQQVAQEWMAKQGARNGFCLDEVSTHDYSVVAFASSERGKPRFGVLEMTGVLTVTEPTLLLERIASGFGRAKAFGCGLMLIRRA